MKKRTFFISAILSLIPISQPLLINTSLIGSTIGLILSFPKKVNAESAYSYFMAGLQKYKTKDYYEAVYDFTKAIEIDPNFAQAYHWRGLVKMLLEDYSSALKDINKTLQFLPNDKKVFGSLGLVKMGLGDMKGACVAWRKSSALGYENAKNWVSKNCTGNTYGI